VQLFFDFVAGIEILHAKTPGKNRVNIEDDVLFSNGN
jgi:hypothetical protein